MTKVLLAGVAALLVPVAFAQGGNVHFAGGQVDDDALPILARDNGFSLTIGHKIAGFPANLDANYGVVVQLEGDGFIESICRNKAKLAPPGRNPATSTSGSLTANFNTDDNGGSFSFQVTTQYANNGACCGVATCELSATPSLCPADCTACKWGEGLEACPNTRNWNQYSSGVAYHSFAVIVSLSDQGTLAYQLRVDCTFASYTVDGDVTTADMTCVDTCVVGTNSRCLNNQNNTNTLLLGAGAIALAGVAGVLVYARRRSSKVSMSPSAKQDVEVDAIICHNSVPHLEEQKA